MDGIITDIQRFSIHDGPGIRTTVFFKGCSLRCFWCHNPETLDPGLQLEFHPDRCMACGACVDSCPHGANALVDGALVFRAERCEVCGACVEVCYTEARSQAGRVVSAEEVIGVVLRDRAFYDDSGGGVTLSGGEPVLQHAFARAVLAGCQPQGVHTAIETAGHYPWAWLEGLLPLIDVVMMDLKQMDSTRHQAATGAPNTRILDTARRLALTDKPLLFRTPVIPTVNDAPDDLLAIADFVRDLRASRAASGGTAPVEYELLKFHQLAGEKYRGLRMDYRAQAIQPLDHAAMDDLAALVRTRLDTPAR